MSVGSKYDGYAEVRSAYIDASDISEEFGHRIDESIDELLDSLASIEKEIESVREFRFRVSGLIGQNGIYDIDDFGKSLDYAQDYARLVHDDVHEKLANASESLKAIRYLVNDEIDSALDNIQDAVDFGYEISDRLDDILEIEMEG